MAHFEILWTTYPRIYNPPRRFCNFQPQPPTIPRRRPGPAPLPGSQAPEACHGAAPVQCGHLVERRGRSAAAAAAPGESAAEAAAESGRAQRWAR